MVLMGLLHLISSPSGSLSKGDQCSTTGLYVQIKGEVRRPGFYGFSEPPTIEEVVAAGGGLTRDEMILGPQKVNTVSHGTTILVEGVEGSKVSIKILPMNAYHKFTLGIPICLDQESAQGLEALPGVGSKIAQAIVETREILGGFRAVEDLLLVPGIGPKLMAKINPYLTLCTDSE